MDTYEGYTADVAIDGDVLVLDRKGLAAKVAGNTGTWRIPLAAVAGVTFKDAGRLVNGWLQLVLGVEPAGKPGDPSDPRTIVFRHKNRAEFAELRDFLLGVLKANQERGIDPATVAYDPPPLTRAAKIEQVQEQVQGWQERAEARQAQAEARQAQTQEAATEARAAAAVAVEAAKAAGADLKGQFKQLKDDLKEAMTGPISADLRAREREKFLARAGKLGITRPDILNAAADMLSHGGTDREVAHLERHLRPGERVRQMAGGRMEERRGIVVLTDTRVLFVAEGLLGGETTDLPLSAISSVTTEHGALLGELEVRAAGREMEVEAVLSDDLRPFAEAVRAEVARRQAAPAAPATAPPAGPDVLDQLARLAQLRDAGAVTAAEFEAKKAELLDRL